MPSVGENMEQLEFSHTAGESTNWYSNYGELFGIIY